MAVPPALKDCNLVCILSTFQQNRNQGKSIKMSKRAAGLCKQPPILCPPPALNDCNLTSCCCLSSLYIASPIYNPALEQEDAITPWIDHVNCANKIFADPRFLSKFEVENNDPNQGSFALAADASLPFREKLHLEEGSREATPSEMQHCN